MTIVQTAQAVKLPVLSPTVLNEADICLRRCQAKYITKEVVFKQSAQGAQGERVHHLLENTCKYGEDKAGYIEEIKDRTTWQVVQTIEHPGWQENEMHILVRTRPVIHKIWDMMNKGWDVSFECEVATDGRGRKSRWWGKDTWGRSKLDVCAIPPNKEFALIIDWKTGKTRGKPSQLHMNAICLRPHTIESLDHGRGGVETFRMFFYYVEGKAKVDHDYFEVYHNTNIIEGPGLAYWAASPLLPTMQIIQDLKQACETNTWPMKPNFLCKDYCDVTACPHWGKKHVTRR